VPAVRGVQNVHADTSALEADVARRSIGGHTHHIATPPENDVATITVDRTSHVEVAFADGMVCRFGLNDLRLACPCAACGLARDRGLAPWPPDDHHAATLAIANAKLVGYGLSVTWSDGHSTGIYAFSALRRWCVDWERGGSAR